MHSVTPATTKQRRHHKSCVHHVHCNPQYFRNRSDLSICNNFDQTRRMSPSSTYERCAWVLCACVHACVYVFVFVVRDNACLSPCNHAPRLSLWSESSLCEGGALWYPATLSVTNKDSEAHHEVWRGRTIVKSYLNSSEGHQISTGATWQQLNWPLPESAFKQPFPEKSERKWTNSGERW